MERIDILYSGLLVTAVILSVWAGVLLTATCVFFAPAIFGPASGSSEAQPSAARFDRLGRSKLAARSS